MAGLVAYYQGKITGELGVVEKVTYPLRFCQASPKIEKLWGILTFQL